MVQFDRIAKFYDKLKTTVFGSSIDQAALFFIKDLADDSQILLIGGGSGSILKGFSSEQKVDYVELSAKMIEQAKKKESKATIEFINADILELDLNKKYDAVITPFSLDCFVQEEILFLFKKIIPQLTLKAYWIQTDFYPQNRLHKWLVSLMYLFFRWTVNLKVSYLPNLDIIFKKYRFLEKNKVHFKRGLIQSRLYQKID